MSTYTNKSIILFDGVCNLCNASVQFIIKRDKGDYFRFAALQSETGKAIANKYDVSDNASSVILIENEKKYTESTAALKIAKKLSGLWPLLYLFIIIPPPIRNSIYRIIAKNRYRWFGKKDECMVPPPEQTHKFI
ncbi:thiol-disulfide oxidoreductase DCC family protein [Perlabentimonas gracilis]|uniref:thiol-disulfide oxidoreductase DCC family protein n=1 Tax=Perlabentimonas gracilis TaxID=2715279 RepID=UPI001C62E8F1|nr:thiol-disulfide oxidoreductase DCC family protein [Perlabentimonas gracilis]